MNYQESKEYKLLAKAKKMVFERVPEAIQVFEEIDETYFIYSDLADSIIAKINDKEFIEKVIDFLDELIILKEDTIDNLIVIQVFQKIYPIKEVDLVFSAAIEERGKLCCVYLKYKLKYLETFT